MTPSDRVRAGGAVLAFDTNAIVRPGKEGTLSFRRFLGCCDAANRLRNAAQKLDVTVVVPALVHFEVLHDLRVRYGPRFDADGVEAGLRSKCVVVAPFDEVAAKGAAQVLHRWFPHDDDWQAEKKQNCLHALGIDDAAGRGLATIDWPLGAQGEGSGWILVTGDQGPEFRRTTLRMSVVEASDVLDALVSERVAS